MNDPIPPLAQVRSFEIHCAGAMGSRWTYTQAATSAAAARSTCESTGAHVLSIREVTPKR